MSAPAEPSPSLASRYAHLATPRLFVALFVAIAALLVIGIARSYRHHHAGTAAAARARAKDGGFIGTASMQRDGTLVLRTSAWSPDVRGRVHSEGRYTPDHPRYAEILRHVGPLDPGHTRRIQPLPAAP